MQSNPYSPRSVVQCLTSAFDVVAGRVKPDEVFDFSAYGFWQAVFGNWILGIVLAVFPLFALGQIYCSVCNHLSSLNPLICFIGLACAGLDGQGRSVYSVSRAVFMGGIFTGGTVRADYHSDADDRYSTVADRDTACRDLDSNLVIQAGTRSNWYQCICGNLLCGWPFAWS